MINRVLIRTKVVQLLYSYMLVEDRFSIESQPQTPTREKRFSYNLYMDLLVMMAGIAENIRRRDGSRPLYDTRFIRHLITDEKIRSLQQKYRMTEFPLAKIEESLTEKVKESIIYKNYLKREEGEMPVGEQIWQEIFNTIILPDPVLTEAISTRENYSLSGIDRMRSMMDSTFRNFYSSADHLPDALNTLERSLRQSYELYFRLMYLPVQLVNLRRGDIEAGMKRLLVTSEYKNPNLRFIENKYVDFLRHNEDIEKALETLGRNMTSDDEPMLRALLKAIMASDLYKEYMELPASDFKADCEFWREIFRQVIFVNPDFLEAMEDRSVFWNDDLDTVGTFVLKTIKRISEGLPYRSIMQMYKDDEDSRFGADLFTAVVRNKDIYQGYINQALDTRLWEADRLAYMDIIIMLTALAEILNFPKIPVQVSVNEYVEIAKAYSTRKSGQFVNGLLAAILRRLHEEGILLKPISGKTESR